jgi:hypothetical protein
MTLQCDDQKITNNSLDIQHPALDAAYKILREEHPDATARYIEKLFEDTYKCNVNFNSSFGGDVTFNTNKDLVWFLLKYSSIGNNE